MVDIEQNQNMSELKSREFLLFLSSEVEKVLIQTHSVIKEAISKLNNQLQKTENKTGILFVLENFNFWLIEYENLIIKLKTHCIPENLKEKASAEAFWENLQSIIKKMLERNEILQLDKDNLNAMNRLANSFEGLKL